MPDTVGEELAVVTVKAPVETAFCPVVLITATSQYPPAAPVIGRVQEMVVEEMTETAAAAMSVLSDRRSLTEASARKYFPNANCADELVVKRDCCLGNSIISHLNCVQRPATFALRTDPSFCPTQIHQQRAAWIIEQVDSKIEPPSANVKGNPRLLNQCRTCEIKRNDFVEAGIVLKQRYRMFLSEVSDDGIRKRIPNRANDGSSQYHIADELHSREKNALER